MTAVGLISSLFLPVLAVADSAEGISFTDGQLWECTAKSEVSHREERLQFVVTGTATKREISRRPNFQNEDVIVSVALTNLDPSACSKAKKFTHLAFEKEALDQCEPKLLGESDALISRRSWKELSDARGKWLIAKQKGKGVVIGLTPSDFLWVLTKRNCPN